MKIYNPAAAFTILSGYTGGRVITIDPSKCGTVNSSNFTMQFAGVYSYLAGTGHSGAVTSASGYDIIFTSDLAGSTLLNWEIESYDTITGTVNFWIKIPTLSASANTVFYMWYGNSSVTTFQGGAAGTAYDGNFAVVYHLPIGTSTANTDSTGNGNTLTNNNGVTAGTGKIGPCGTFNGTNQYMQAPTSATLQVPLLTFSAWINPTNSATAGIIMDHNQAPGFWNSGQGSASNLDLVSNNFYGTGTCVSSATWQLVAATHDGTNDRYYVNGALVATIADVFAYPNGTNALAVGSVLNGTSKWFGGSIQEARVSKVVRTPSWILAEYNNQNSPTTFYSIATSPLAANFVGPWAGVVNA